MKRSIVLTLVVLVLAPAALLIMIVATIFGNWEGLIEQRVIRVARRAVSDTALRVAQRLADEVDVVTREAAALLRSGWDSKNAETRLSALAKERVLVNQVYLFFNPWGFVYPTELAEERRDPAEGEDARRTLSMELRQRLTGARIGGAHHFALDGERYSFLFSPEGNGVYVGVKFEEEEVGKLFWRIARVNEGEGIGLRIESLQRQAEAAGKTFDVVVSDTFSDSVWLSARSVGEALAGAALDSPFEDFAVIAYLQDPNSWRRAGSMGAQLFAWGTALLALSLIFGVFLVWRGVRDEIRRASEKSALIAGISHDLRTPLASIRMLSESLYDGQVANEERKQKFLLTILQETRRLSQLVDRVLFFVKYGEQAVSYSREVCRPDAWIRTTVSEFVAREYGADGTSRISLDVGEHLPDVAIDRVAMTQVLVNLLDNAKQYGMPKPGVESEADIEVSLYYAGDSRAQEGKGFGRVVFTVRDFGAGVPPKEIRYLFGRYYRSQSAVESRKSGVGLGLSVCRQIVQAHGGRIVAELADGGGMRFTVALPALARETAVLKL